MKIEKGFKPPSDCAKCGSENKLTPSGGKHLCDICLAMVRKGRDKTTTLVKQSAFENQNHFDIEEIKPEEIKLYIDGMTPEMIRNDATNHRGMLLSYTGVDCAAMALQLEVDMKAENSAEKMLCHLMAMAYKGSMEVMRKAYLEDDVVIQSHRLKSSSKMIDSFSRAMLTMQKVKNGGNQHIVVQHLNVSEGGNALIGIVEGKGKLEK